MHNILNMPLGTLLQDKGVENIFEALDLHIYDKNIVLSRFLDNLSSYTFLDFGTTKAEFVENIAKSVCSDKIEASPNFEIKEISILGGYDKNKTKEKIHLTFKPGDIICLVGTTGAGKSQLLEDIEYLSQGDSPSQRVILLNKQKLSNNQRAYFENKLCARLSQNMNFIMDLSVHDFIFLHAECRIENATPEILKAKTQQVINAANELSGESFDASVPVTRLSGGQSRALMIADIALLSNAKIILIDELENAGVDKEKALNLLSGVGKIILISTHDPILALSGHKRIIIKNGAIVEIVEKNREEAQILEQLKSYDNFILKARNAIRAGKQLSKE